MADFLRGFAQGARPGIRNIGDLISRTLLEEARQGREFHQELALGTQRGIQEQALLRQTLQAEQSEQALQSKVFDEVLGGDLTNFRALTPSNRVAVNQQIKKTEPKVLFQTISHPTRGTIVTEITVPKGGDPTFRELKTTPRKVSADVRNIGGRKVTTTTFSDGTKIETKKEDISKVEKKSRRDLFNDPNSDIRSFKDEYRARINRFNIKRKALRDADPITKQFDETFKNSAQKLEIERATLTDSQLDLLPDQEMADQLNKIVGQPASVWDRAYDRILEIYKEDGVSSKERQQIWLLHTIYEIQHGGVSPIFRPFIQ